MSTYPTRIRRAPRRFDLEDFVPGANNKHTVGRTVDAGQDVDPFGSDADRMQESEHMAVMRIEREELNAGGVVDHVASDGEWDSEASESEGEWGSESEEEEEEVWDSEEEDDDESYVESHEEDDDESYVESQEEKEDSVYFSVNENASWEEWGRRLRREWGGMNDDPDEGSQWTDEEWGLWAKEQINALWDDSQGDVPTDEEWVEWGKRVFCHAGITVNDDWTNEVWVKWGKELCWNARMVTLNVEWANWAKSEWAKWGDGPAGDWSSAEWTEWGKSLFAMTVV